MPRRGYKKRPDSTDPVYDSMEVAKLIGYLMVDGKKSVAARIVYRAFDLIKEKNLSPIDVLHKALQNVAPTHEVKPKRVGGASYLVPMETRPGRKIFLAFNWIIDAARGRANKEYHTFEEKLATELMDAYQQQGSAVNKRVQMEKLADQNKAFAHFRW